MSRDPIGERFALSLYDFVLNNPADTFDVLGEEAYKPNLSWEDFTGTVPDSAPADIASQIHMSGIRVSDYGTQPTVATACVTVPASDCIGMTIERTWWVESDFDDTTGQFLHRERKETVVATEAIVKEEGGCCKCTVSFPEIVLSVDFDPTKSWVRAHGETAYLLSHEQGHLDALQALAQAWQPRLRALTTAATHCGCVRAFTQARQDWFQAYNHQKAHYQSMERQYDEPTQTDHSRNREQQALWLEKIGSWFQYPGLVPEPGSQPAKP